MMKRTVSILLCICMMICMVPDFAQTAYAAGNKPPVYKKMSDSYKSGKYYDQLMSVTLSGNQVQDLVNVARSQVGYRASDSIKDLSGNSKNSKGYNLVEYFNRISSGLLKTKNKNGEYIGASWCATFVTWCFREAGISENIIPNATGCGAIRECYKKGAVYHSRESGYIPKKGDLVLYESMNKKTKTTKAYKYYTPAKRDKNGVPTSSSHVGIVSQDGDSKGFWTIQRTHSKHNGRTGDRVDEFYEEYSSKGRDKNGKLVYRIQGFLTPKYSSTVASNSQNAKDAAKPASSGTSSSTQKKAIYPSNGKLVLSATSIAKGGTLKATPSATDASYFNFTIRDAADSGRIFNRYSNIKPGSSIEYHCNTPGSYQIWCEAFSSTGNSTPVAKMDFRVTEPSSSGSSGSSGSVSNETGAVGGAGAAMEQTGAGKYPKNLEISVNGRIFIVGQNINISVLGDYDKVSGSIRSANDQDKVVNSYSDLSSVRFDCTEPGDYVIKAMASVNGGGSAEAPDLYFSVVEAPKVTVNTSAIRLNEMFDFDVLLPCNGSYSLGLYHKEGENYQNIGNMAFARNDDIDCRQPARFLPRQTGDYMMLLSMILEKEGIGKSHQIDLKYKFQVADSSDFTLSVNGADNSDYMSFSNTMASAKSYTEPLVNKGYFDVYINGELAAENVSSFYKALPKGTSYEIRNIEAYPGFEYKGLGFISSKTSGTMSLDSNYSVELKFAEKAIENDPLVFTDVPESSYYREAVSWALSEGVTDGTSATKFSPGKTVTRAQAVTFLWRSAGEPAPSSTYNPFKDVPDNAYFHDAVLWAVEMGITDGTSEDRFSPEVNCSHAHILTFLYRAMGEPGKIGLGTWYEDAVNWANDNNILMDNPIALTKPSEDCLRGDVVNFIYMNYGETGVNEE